MSYRSFVLSLLPIWLLFVAWHAKPSMAGATEESELECQPREVEPNQAFRCYIYVRDALQEPTTRFNLSDFTIRVLPEVQSAVVTVTDPVVSGDPTIIEFTVASSEGTNLRIAVVSTDTGRFIRSSDLIVSVLTWPASKLGAITCDKSVLTLRSSTICTADVTSKSGLPAVVHSNDVYFSEDHSAGSFVFLRGVRQLRFNFTAPASLHSPLKVFVLRITLAGVTTVYTIRIPMAYPALPATERSVLRCTSAADQIQPCFVNAADAVGPVLFNPSQFLVRFERIRGNAWVDNTANVVYSWKTGTVGDASMLLQFAPVVDNEVYTSRLLVLTNSTSEQREILNSPMQFMMGTPPTWQQLSFRGCNSSFLTVGNVTLCTIDVSTGVSADPAYVKIRSDLRGSTITGPIFKHIKKTGLSVLMFTYSPPTTPTRQDDFLTVTVGGMNIVRSPWRLVVYPAAVDVVVTDTSSNRSAIIAVGIIYFGAILATGGTILLLLERQKGRVKKLRAEQAHKQLVSRMSDRLKESEGGSSTTPTAAEESDKPLTEAGSMARIALTAHQLAEGSAQPLVPRSALPTDGTTIRDYRPKTPEMVM